MRTSIVMICLGMILVHCVRKKTSESEVKNLYGDGNLLHSNPGDIDIAIGKEFPRKVFPPGRVPADIESWLEDQKSRFLKLVNNSWRYGRLKTKIESKGRRVVIGSDFHGNLPSVVEFLVKSNLIDYYAGIDTVWKGKDSNLLL